MVTHHYFPIITRLWWTLTFLVMKHKITAIILFFCTLIVSGQKIIINEGFRVDSTKIEFRGYHNYVAYSTIDNKKSDTLIVSIYSIGLSRRALI